MIITNGMSAAALPGARWRKPTASIGNSNCAELAGIGDGRVAIRQNTDPSGPALVLDRPGFAGFVADAKAGGLDHLLI